MICGIDLGSRNVKLAMMGPEEEIQLYKYDTMPFYREYGRQDEKGLIINFAALGFHGIDTLVSTGYGRNTVKIKGGEEIPEIKAHVLGAIYQTGLQDFTLLDLGGQDSKVALIREGRLVDFQTNDKCAAGSGRYLENMAGVLGISLAELSRHYENPVELNATCAIFGESELINKVLEGYSIETLAASVNRTIVQRVKAMLRNLGSPRLVFTGGVAQNSAIRKLLADELGIEITVPKEPQFNGAIGCCVYGLEKSRQRGNV